MATMPLVYIVILNWNGWRDTLECLGSLGRLDYPRYRIVVVDNASSDASEAKLREAYPELTFLQSGANLGFAGGTNLGIRYALKNGADYVWLLNNDTVVETDALTHLVERMGEKPGAGMCGSTLVYYHDRNKIQAFAGATYNKWLGVSKHIGQGLPRGQPLSTESVEKKLDYIIGASLLVSRKLLEDIGLMCEDYFLYYEEIDWATRAKSHYTLAFAADSIVYHKEGASTGGNNQKLKEKSWTADYYAIKNRVVFTKKFFPHALGTVYLGLIITIFNRIRRGQWKRLKMIIQKEHP